MSFLFGCALDSIGIITGTFLVYIGWNYYVAPAFGWPQGEYLTVFAACFLLGSARRIMFSGTL